MTKIKSYTDIEQSKKLAEILSIESADMWYSYYGNPKYNPTIAYEGEQWFLCHIRNSLHTDIPCWSLAALFNVLPNTIGNYNKILGWFDNSWHCKYMDEDGEGSEYSFSVDNPIDACFGMIIKLHEIGMNYGNSKNLS